jgi:hypothetical protein
VRDDASVAADAAPKRLQTRNAAREAIPPAPYRPIASWEPQRSASGCTRDRDVDAEKVREVPVCGVAEPSVVLAMQAADTLPAGNSRLYPRGKRRR